MYTRYVYIYIYRERERYMKHGIDLDLGERPVEMQPLGAAKKGG